MILLLDTVLVCNRHRNQLHTYSIACAAVLHAPLFFRPHQRTNFRQSRGHRVISLPLQLSQQAWGNHIYHMNSHSCNALHLAIK